jgi:hypothetical protein
MGWPVISVGWPAISVGWPAIEEKTKGHGGETNAPRKKGMGEVQSSLAY